MRTLARALALMMTLVAAGLATFSADATRPPILTLPRKGGGDQRSPSPACDRLPSPSSERAGVGGEDVAPTENVGTPVAADPAGNAPGFAREVPEIHSGPPRFAFNGKDLAGFYPFTRYHKLDDPDRVFSVRDGMIRVSGLEFGGLATTESFADYHLVVEWKWGSNTAWPRRYNARNSGVMVHGVGPDGAAFGSWIASIECQIIEGGTGDLLVVPSPGFAPSLTSEVRQGADGQPHYQPGGESKTLRAGRFNWWGRDPDWRDVIWFRGPRDVERPVGEWNRMEVLCDGGSIQVRLNGVLVNAASGAAWSSGKILLQSEGAEISFRKFEVRPLLK